MYYRVGIGYDVHKLVRGRKLIIGGVEIEFPLGLLGHSDADVLLHAIGDALLGAANLGDLGVHFPPSDSKWKNISSLKILEVIYNLLKKDNWIICNIDSVIIAQEPKMRPYIPKMRREIAAVLNMNENDISIKATTTEKLGYLGRKEGIAAESVILLRKEKIK